MVPKACETPNIGCVRKTSTDECLLAKPERKPSEPSLLLRFLSSLGFIRNDNNSYPMAIENEDFSENCESETMECRTCDKKFHVDSKCECDYTEGKPTSTTGKFSKISLLFSPSLNKLVSIVLAIKREIKTNLLTQNQS